MSSETKETQSYQEWNLSKVIVGIKLCPVNMHWEIEESIFRRLFIDYHFVIEPL